MLSLKDIDMQCIETLEKHHQNTKEQIEVLQHTDNERTKRFCVLNKILPALVETLEKLGLGIEQLTTNKTGDGVAWKDGDKLRVCIHVMPTSAKFKFIRFAGYKANGAGRNQERLSEKANKLKDMISASVGGLSVGVNPYSLELKNDQETKRILVDFWID